MNKFKQRQKNIRVNREKSGLRQQDVADRLGISLNQYRLWEEGDLYRQLEKVVDKFQRVSKAISGAAS